jgi:hypothetical protein
MHALEDECIIELIVVRPDRGGCVSGRGGGAGRTTTDSNCHVSAVVPHTQQSSGG